MSTKEKNLKIFKITHLLIYHVREKNNTTGENIIRDNVNDGSDIDNEQDEPEVETEPIEDDEPEVETELIEDDENMIEDGRRYNSKLNF